MKRLLGVVTVSLLLLLTWIPAMADQIVNGDFSQSVVFNNSQGWESEEGLGTTAPSDFVIIEDGAAKIFTGGLATGPSLITLYQGLDIPVWADTLSFDIAFGNLPSDSGTTSDSSDDFPDFLQVSYFDSGSKEYDKDFVGLDINGPYDPSTSGSLSNSIDDGGWYSFEFDISDLVNREGTLYFDLSDQDDGYYSIARVDNVRINPAPVPEPTTLVLSGLGLLLAGASIRRLRRKQTRDSSMP